MKSPTCQAFSRPEMAQISVLAVNQKTICGLTIPLVDTDPFHELLRSDTAMTSVKNSQYIIQFVKIMLNNPMRKSVRSNCYFGEDISIY